MEFFRYCKTCDEENPDFVSDCSKCGVSILDIIPEPRRNLLPIEDPKQIAKPFIILSLENGDEITVHSGDTLGRSTCGKELLKDYCNVSRKHATIQNIDGIWVVRDEKTLNGTFINGEKIEPGVWKKVKNGDCLELSPICPLKIRIG